jgi:hypothetical protein
VPYRDSGDVLCTSYTVQCSAILTDGVAIPEKGNALPTTQSLAVGKLALSVEQPDSPGARRNQNRTVRR